MQRLVQDLEYFVRDRVTPLVIGLLRMELDQVVLVQGVANVSVDLLVVDVRLLKQLELTVEEVLDGGRVLTEIDSFLGTGLRLQGSLRVTGLDFACFDLVDELPPCDDVIFRLTEEDGSKLR